MRLLGGALSCSPENGLPLRVPGQTNVSMGLSWKGVDQRGYSFSPVMTDLSLFWQWISHLPLYQAAMKLMGKQNTNSSRQSYEIGHLYSAISLSKSAFKHNFRVQFLLSPSRQLISPKAGLVTGILASKTIIPRCVCILINDFREADLAWIYPWKHNVETYVTVQTPTLTNQAISKL